MSRRVCARMRGGGGVGHFERKRARAVLISLARSLDRSLARARTRSLSRILYSLSLSVSLYLSIYLSCLSLHSLSLSRRHMLGHECPEAVSPERGVVLTDLQSSIDCQ